MNRLAELRKEHKLSQASLGKEIGVAQNTLCNWEKGNREIDREMIERLADYFKVSIDYLMGKSNYRNIKDVQNVAWGQTSNPFFEAPFDFCGLLKDIREEQGISVSDMCKVIGCTEEQYAECEEGILPITCEQAEKFCEYLGTNVSQVLFDNNLYDGEVPEEYHDDVRAWERLQDELDEEAKAESSKSAPKIKNPDILMIARAGEKMTPEQAENLRKYAQYVFPEAFKND